MIQDYTKVDRIVLFKDLTYDEMKQEIDDRKFEDILLDHYEDFVRVCEIVESRRERIKSVSCVFENDELTFDIREK